MSVSVTYSDELRAYMQKSGRHDVVVEMYQPQC